MLSRFTIQYAKHYTPNWFDCLIVCPFWAKSGKYYSEKHLWEINAVMKERAVTALGFYLIMESCNCVKPQ